MPDYVDVFTVDGNVEHIISHILGKPLPAPQGSKVDREIVCFPTGQLARVAAALRRKAAALPEFKPGETGDEDLSQRSCRMTLRREPP